MSGRPFAESNWSWFFKWQRWSHLEGGDGTEGRGVWLMNLILKVLKAKLPTREMVDKKDRHQQSRGCPTHPVFSSLPGSTVFRHQLPKERDCSARGFECVSAQQGLLWFAWFWFLKCNLFFQNFIHACNMFSIIFALTFYPLIPLVSFVSPTAFSPPSCSLNLISVPQIQKFHDVVRTGLKFSLPASFSSAGIIGT